MSDTTATVEQLQARVAHLEERCEHQHQVLTHLWVSRQLDQYIRTVPPPADCDLGTGDILSRRLALLANLEFNTWTPVSDLDDGRPHILRNDLGVLLRAGLIEQRHNPGGPGLGHQQYEYRRRTP